MNPNTSLPVPDPSPLRVPKRAVTVDLLAGGGPVRTVDVFLAPPARVHEDGERLADLLVRPRFLPVREHGAVTFFNSHAITWLRMPLLHGLEELPAEVESSADAVSWEVSVELLPDGMLEGTLRYLQPPHLRRLGDYLANLPAFFPLRTPDWIYLVNRACVMQVLPQQEVRHE